MLSSRSLTVLTFICLVFPYILLHAADVGADEDQVAAHKYSAPWSATSSDSCAPEDEMALLQTRVQISGTKPKALEDYIEQVERGHTMPATGEARTPDSPSLVIPRGHMSVRDVYNMLHPKRNAAREMDLHAKGHTDKEATAPRPAPYRKKPEEAPSAFQQKLIEAAALHGGRASKSKPTADYRKVAATTRKKIASQQASSAANGGKSGLPAMRHEHEDNRLRVRDCPDCGMKAAGKRKRPRSYKNPKGGPQHPKAQASGTSLLEDDAEEEEETEGESEGLIFGRKGIRWKDKWGAGWFAQTSQHPICPSIGFLSCRR
eukprot:gnl/TRDRNA2_/TRDRNA2_151543_c2_seq2.p2 gnl/TRDRNA2_/TRDRNA2_151543_c2~~gnl/TRDRNA2_/TRDRNA2_151543_c2_seq2.p2  ORF type:complete len:318 (-),score=48.48 gnl/TRDRNA2_/TRDRNA2_151543_c2_seq2:919-1872(-)